jgi:hypothetical protein
VPGSTANATAEWIELAMFKVLTLLTVARWSNYTCVCWIMIAQPLALGDDLAKTTCKHRNHLASFLYGPACEGGMVA